MNAILAPLDPNFTAQSADGDSDRRDRMGRMAALCPAPLTLPEARLVRDIRMAQVLDHAESIAPGWSRVAYLYLVKFSQQRWQFIGHDVVEASQSEIDQPHDTRAWGQIFRHGLKVGFLRQIGYAQAPHRHASPVPRWESAIYREAA